MSTDLALHDAHSRLAASEQRFNALAEVAGREMPRYLKRSYTVPLTIGIAALGAAAEAKYQTKGAIGNLVVAAVAYGVGMMSGENADLREGAYAIATGLGSAAATIAAHDKIVDMISSTSAPAPAPAPSLPAQA